MTFQESIAKALPHLQKAWSASKPPAVVSEPPVVHATEKANTKAGRGFTDAGTIIKAQQMAVPASQAAAGAGDVSSQAAAMAPPQMAGAK